MAEVKKAESPAKKWYNTVLLGVLFFLVGRFIIVDGALSDILIIVSAVLVIYGIVEAIKSRKKRA